jgi:CHAD domain-containing protein
MTGSNDSIKVWMGGVLKPVLVEFVSEYFRNRFNEETKALRKEIKTLKEELGSLKADFTVDSTVRRSQIVDLPAFVRERDAA